MLSGKLNEPTSGKVSSARLISQDKEDRRGGGRDSLIAQISAQGCPQAKNEADTHGFTFPRAKARREAPSGAPREKDEAPRLSEQP